MSEFYEAQFRWPHPEANHVIVTGSFDSWSGSTQLRRSPSGFRGTVQIPWGHKVTYKYVVDGRWTTTDDQPTELDSAGNLNNTLRAPARPATPPKPAPAPPAEVPKPVVEEKPAANGVLESAKQAAVNMVEAIAPGTTETPAQSPAEETTPTPTPAPEPAPVEPQAEPAPTKPEPEATPAEPEVSIAPAITTEAILPSKDEPTAPEVPVPVLPLSTEPPVEKAVVPVADVSETKPLETTIVEGATTTETAVTAAPEATPAPAAEKPSTHEPAPPATNGDAPVSTATPAPEKPITNGTTTTLAPAPAPETPVAKDAAASATPAKDANGTAPSPPVTPKQEKRGTMRFPSFTRHSRSQTSDASEHGEAHSPEGKEKDSPVSRFGTAQRKKRTSIFGSIRNVFHSPKEKA